MLFLFLMISGDGGNRTHVRKHGLENHYVRSLSLVFTACSRQTEYITAKPDLSSPVFSQTEKPANLPESTLLEDLGR